MNSLLQSPPRIAIVDDDAALRFVFTITLETEGFQTKEFTGPTDFIEKRAVEEVDALIVDLRMPGEMSGLALVEKLRNDGAKIPVILCSANITPPIENSAREIGVEAVLRKPVSPCELRQRVHEALDEQFEIGRER